MTFPKTLKPSTALHGGPASTDRFAGEIDTNNTLTDKQAQQLSRRFAISLPIALTIAALHYSGGRAS